MSGVLDRIRQSGIKTFCQIVGQEITATICLETQGQEGCFGCAAPTRLCELCHKRPVDVPAVGMCSRCLTGQLKLDEKVVKPVFKPMTRVDCQIFKREINSQVCLASQGQGGCRNCAAKTRLCENCRIRPVRFKQYGLCLTCSVDEYAHGWTPETGDGDDEADDESTDPPRSGESGPARRVTSLEVSSGTVHVGGKDYHVSTRVRVPLKGGEASVSPSHPEIIRPDQELEKLTQRAKSVVMSHRRASVGLLRRELGVTWAIGKELITRLEKGGVVGPERPKTSRKVLVLTDIRSTGKDPRHVKPVYPNTKANRLMGQARRVILKHRKTSCVFLQSQLGICKGTAKKILDRLEADGFVGPGIRGHERQILGEETKSPDPISKTTFSQKTRVLTQLLRLLGEQNETASIVREIIQDLGELKQLKDTLRQLGKG